MPWELEIGRESFKHLEHMASQTNRKEELEPLAKKQLLKKWEKMLNLPSELPDLKIWKFDTEALGAFKI
jgi:uncharacterized protein YmfQ (DUF2313 family)